MADEKKCGNKNGQQDENEMDLILKKNDVEVEYNGDDVNIPLAEGSQFNIPLGENQKIELKLEKDDVVLKVKQESEEPQSDAGSEGETCQKKESPTSSVPGSSSEEGTSKSEEGSDSESNCGCDDEDDNDANPVCWTGEGTKDSPYLIKDGDDLYCLASYVNEGNRYMCKYFQLANDITIEACQWTPIGKGFDEAGKEYYFGGYFNGYDENRVAPANEKGFPYLHRITWSGEAEGAAYWGLFGDSHGVIANLIIEGELTLLKNENEVIYEELKSTCGESNDSGQNKSGSSAMSSGDSGEHHHHHEGRDSEGSSSDSSEGNEEEVNDVDDSYVSPLVGFSSGCILHCINKANFYAIGFNNVGGIVGALQNATADEENKDPIKVYQCSNTGNISGYKRVGGIAGAVYCILPGNAVLEQCSCCGDCTIYSRNPYTRVYTGGLVGYLDGVIKYCYSDNIILRASGGWYNCGAIGIAKGSDPVAGAESSYTNVVKYEDCSEEHDRPFVGSCDESPRVCFIRCCFTEFDRFTQPTTFTKHDMWGQWDCWAAISDSTTQINRSSDECDNHNIAWDAVAGRLNNGLEDPVFIYVANVTHPVLKWEADQNYECPLSEGCVAYPDDYKTQICLVGDNAGTEPDSYCNSDDTVTTLGTALNMADPKGCDIYEYGTVKVTNESCIARGTPNSFNNKIVIEGKGSAAGPMFLVADNASITGVKIVTSNRLPIVDIQAGGKGKFGDFDYFVGNPGKCVIKIESGAAARFGEIKVVGDIYVSGTGIQPAEGRSSPALLISSPSTEGTLDISGIIYLVTEDAIITINAVLKSVLHCKSLVEKDKLEIGRTSEFDPEDDKAVAQATEIRDSVLEFLQYDSENYEIKAEEKSNGSMKYWSFYLSANQ